MKYLLVAAAAAAAAGGLFALRGEPVVVRDRRVEVEVPVRVEVPVEVERRVEEKTQVAETPANTKVERRAEVTPSAPLAPQEKMLFLFERELDLTADQRRHFVQVLADRRLEIEEVNGRIAEAKIFSRSTYSATIRALRAKSYERMAEVLDGAQHRRFVALVREGRLGDAVALTIDPAWTVID